MPITERNAPCPCGSGKKYKKCCLGKMTPMPDTAPQVAAMHDLDVLAYQHDSLQHRGVPKRQANPFEVLYRKGITEFQAGRQEDALSWIDKALAINPCHPFAYYNRGMILLKLKRLAEAIFCLDRALMIKDDLTEAHNNRGIALCNLDRAAEALASFQRALKFKPNDANIYNNRGLALQSLNRYDEAQASFSRSLVLDPHSAMAHHNLGVTLQNQGQVEAALVSYERALSIVSARAWVYFDSKLLALNYPSDRRPQGVYEAHCDYAKRFEGPLRSTWPAHANGRDPGRRLKVGYVSPDFRRHSVAYFIEPILAHHDKGQVEVYCYYNSGVQDDVTARLRGYADRWLDCKELTDDQLAERIRADGIDILVDLAGHTRHNRLRVFARKPAPVQVTYLGYVATTGLEAMDYRLSHLDADPEGNERYNSETLYRLPRSLWCYRPAADMPAVEVGRTGRGNGHITYGSLNNIAKISEATVAVWSRLLRALPESRLIMAGVPRGSAQQGMEARFAAQGIEAGRLELHDKMSHGEFRKLHRRIDIALDPFPHNGNTTTCESLYLGVPVVTLIGEQFVARFGYTLLKAMGMEGLAARDEAEYVAIAVNLGRDLPRLTEMHATLRERFAGSVLCDEAGFTRDLEAAYRTMWQRWCAS